MKKIAFIVFITLFVIQGVFAQKPITCTVYGEKFVMKPVPPAMNVTLKTCYTKGYLDADCYCLKDVVRTVSLSPFYMAETEVTEALWKAVMDEFPKGFLDRNLYDDTPTKPVVTLTWEQAAKFCNRLTMLVMGVETKEFAYWSDPDHTVPYFGESNGDRVFIKLDARGFRMPTEMEWQWAMMGGGNPDLKPGSGIDIKKYAWVKGTTKSFTDSKNETHYYRQPVKGKKPNGYGLYDMIGNVYEWCNDDYMGQNPKLTGILADFKRELRSFMQANAKPNFNFNEEKIGDLTTFDPSECDANTVYSKMKELFYFLCPEFEQSRYPALESFLNRKADHIARNLENTHTNPLYLKPNSSKIIRGGSVRQDQDKCYNQSRWGWRNAARIGFRIVYHP